MTMKQRLGASLAKRHTNLRWNSSLLTAIKIRDICWFYVTTFEIRL